MSAYSRTPTGWPAVVLCGCGHPLVLHDVEEHHGDGTDLCCVDGCDQRGCQELNEANADRGPS